MKVCVGGDASAALILFRHLPSSATVVATACRKITVQRQSQCHHKYMYICICVYECTYAATYRHADQPAWLHLPYPDMMDCSQALPSS